MPWHVGQARAHRYGGRGAFGHFGVDIGIAADHPPCGVMLPVTFENATFLLQFWQAVDGSGNNCMGQGASAGGVFSSLLIPMSICRSVLACC